MEEITKHILPVKSDIKILVVDDREDNLFSMETILEKDGYNIHTANSGRAALRMLLKEHDFTLILMDVQMPDLNGFETATLIYERDKLKHIPIIFVTANEYGVESVYKGYQMGGVDYVYKPLNPELLRAKVAVFVELYRKNHQLLAQDQKMKEANKLLEKEIEERAKSEEQVNLLNKQLLENISQLKATNEELERFAYVASHDLQEPLRKIILFSDQLATRHKNALNIDGQNIVDRVIKAAERMRVLIKNILMFSKSSTTEEVFEDTNLNVLIEGILSDLEVSIAQKKAVFDIQELPKLKIIPSQFRQLFQNLIINSLKFSREDCSPEVSIYTKQIKGIDVPKILPSLYDEDYFNIYVKDNGIGFEQKYADEIFTLFKRLNTYDKYEGTGIGLSICKKIMDKHKGYISATSSEGQGTTFILSLPLKETQNISVSIHAVSNPA
jgi:signal transduction histidine kinase